ncbi:hypothetical protein [Methyloradius palustris]|uniref:HNH endonuclease n=1 Tax=Methyloradius palustris TaxID=2778876 RepID=A0A8D5G9S0_9PROT|nr:hypothetical protein [Methyloradius palustris]BCM25717.1 hypothetical protein ZMTM_19760 [Methyloradius palustris]
MTLKIQGGRYLLLSSLLACHLAFAGDLPDPLITPGAIDSSITQENIQETVCVKGYTKTVRPPAYYTNKLKKSQLREYGFADQNPKHYEEDHLIPLNIGGAPEDRLNLWPQTRISEWNASKKDVLELKLYKLVCDGRVPLAEARQAMATDWIKAYKQYVQKTD